MEYNEVKDKFNKVATDYKNEVIFRCAVLNIVQYGMETFTEEYMKFWFDAIDRKHDKAEQENKILLYTREFDKTIAKCTYALSKFEPVDFLMYVQREVWFYNKNDDISYNRAIELLCDTVNYALRDRETDVAKEDLEFIGFDDEDLISLGFEEVFFYDDDEEF